MALLGHNGSGKSTLARHCNALLMPDRGQVLVAGMDTQVPTCQRRIRDTVGMIFQQPDNQIIATIVEDDVAWALTVRGLPAPLIVERVTMPWRTWGSPICASSRPSVSPVDSASAWLSRACWRCARTALSLMKPLRSLIRSRGRRSSICYTACAASTA